MSYMEFSAMLFLGGLAVVVVVLVRHMLTERRRSRLQDGRVEFVGSVRCV